MSFREGGDDEGAVGDALRTRDSYLRVRRPFQRGYFEFLGETLGVRPRR